MPIQNYRFDYLQDPVKRLILGWANRASEDLGAQDAETFEPFIYCWIAFNAWAAVVTNEEKDFKIINVLAADAVLDKQFTDLRAAGPKFATVTEQFQSWWPIFKDKDLRRFNVQDNAVERRQVVIDRLNFEPTLKRAPKDDNQPWRAGTDFPLSWENTIRAIYQVRCNLFHGDKSVSSEVDQEVVGAAYRVLMRYFDVLIHPR